MTINAPNSQETQSLPLGPYPRIVTHAFDVPGIDQLEVYRAHGGYEALAKALRDFQPEELAEEVKASGLRGRGGAGFATGVKWGFLPKESAQPRYLCVNADESEPGTFKDRMIMEVSPHQVVEGTILAAYATRVRHAFIYIRGELPKAYQQVERAVQEAYAAGLLGKNILGSGYDLEITVHPRRGSLHLRRGERAAGVAGGQARLSTPQAAVPGGRRPLRRPDGHQQRGDRRQPAGDRAARRGDLCAVWHGEEQGHARLLPERACRAARQLRAAAGHAAAHADRGVRRRRAGMARSSRRSSPAAPPRHSLTPEQMDTPLDFESVAAAGSMLGSGGVVVLDEDTCIVGAVLRMTEFYRDESCGKCTPCREGTYWLVQLLERLEEGHGKESDIRSAGRHL